MDRSLYIAMTGAGQNMLATAVHANNLANVSTTGFRGDFAQAKAMPVFGGLASRAYALTETPATDMAPGTLQESGRDLDVAINGEGWIAVQAPDGSEAYTRAGDLRIDTSGLLLTGSDPRYFRFRGFKALVALANRFGSAASLEQVARFTFHADAAAPDPSLAPWQDYRVFSAVVFALTVILVIVHW